LIKDLKNEWNIIAKTGVKGNNPYIILTRHCTLKSLKEQGYQITTKKGELQIMANGEDGLFYGTQTLLQLIQKDNNGYKIPGLTITDWPGIMNRAIHYATNHHQDKHLM
jgi:N-acetyl-beta-hexosaminidase